VQDNSPGYKAGLEPFFDFIVAIENTRLVDTLIDLIMMKVLVVVEKCWSNGVWGLISLV
jgi:hypothetical protein